VDDVIAVPFRHGELGLRSRWKIGHELKARRYDQAIVLPNTWKAALVPFFADIPVRSGYAGEFRYGLLNLTYRKKNLAMPLHYGQLSEPPGKEPKLPLPSPSLRFAVHEVEAARHKFGLPARYAVFCPGAEYGPAKRWPASHYAELGRSLHASSGLPVVLLGSGGEAGLCTEIAAAAAPAVCQVLAGSITLADAMAVLAAARGVVSNDSGLMHVAAAVGVPQAAVFGSTSPVHTPPLNRRAQVLWLKDELQLDCAPCFDRTCRFGHTRCLTGVSAGRVEDALARALATSADPVKS
jgi:heptosyltransferase-2